MPLISQSHVCTLQRDLSEHYDKQFKYDVVYDYADEKDVHTAATPSIPLSVIQWVHDNSESDNWGWYFNQKHNTKYAYLSFDNENDALWFILTYGNKEN